jgi:hypothetical protein
LPERNPFARRGEDADHGQKCHDAEAALVLGLAGLLIPLLSPFAILYGFRARRQVEASQGTLSGVEQAVGGLCLGFLVVFGWVLLILAIATGVFDGV